jgi:hypothetical protein
MLHESAECSWPRCGESNRSIADASGRRQQGFRRLQAALHLFMAPISGNSWSESVSALSSVESSDLITAAFRGTAEYCVARGRFLLVVRPIPLDPIQITMV